MSTKKEKFKKFKIKAKPLALVTISFLGSMATKMLTDKFEKQTNIQDIHVNVYNYIINSLSESAIMDFVSKFSQNDNTIEYKEESNVDAAYEFIMKNVKFEKNDYIDISFQKKENGILITYVFNKQYSEYFYKKGLSLNDLFSLANTIGEMNIQLLNCLKNNLGFVVPIETKVYTHHGDLLIHIENGQLKELNGIRPALTTQEI
jgi:hypothetical protein